jgi:DNA-binding response OmpR family regulator
MAPYSTKILLAEDDPNFGSVLKDYLEMQDFSVILAENGTEALRCFKEVEPQICILDVMMPQKDGFELAREIRKRDPDIPLLFLTAKSMKEDMLRGYQVGADDYLTKPFDTEVLLYKIKAILNRTQPEEAPPSEYTIGRFRYHPETRELALGSKKRNLSPKEGALLQLLSQNKGHVVSRAHALNKIWKENNYFTGRSMDVYLAKLRKYLKDDPQVAIVNVHSEGFRLVEDL